MANERCPSCGDVRKLYKYRGERICTSCKFVRRACVRRRDVVVQSLIGVGMMPKSLMPLYHEVADLKAQVAALRFQVAVKQLGREFAGV